MDQDIREISESIWEELGPGYSEAIYHCAFEVALRRGGVYQFETERIIPVYYSGLNIGHVRADLIINREAVIELKSISKINEVCRIQIRNYMKLLGLEKGYLINFPDRVGQFEFEIMRSE